jgi:hypothetical protein
MPSALRTQVALIGLLAVLLIPISTSSLRGLTHILTCRDEIDTPFSVMVLEDGPPVVLSAASIRPDGTGRPRPNEICGGLTLSILMRSRVQNRADVTLAIANNSDYGWRGSVQLRLGDTSIPIHIGAVNAATTSEETFEIRLDPGRTYEVAGSLLIGP